MHEFARKRMKIASDAMKRKSNLREFNIEDSVWVYDPMRKVGVNPKLQRPWKGPFKVVEKLSYILYRVKQSPRHKPRTVHHDKLRMYKGRNLTVNVNTLIFELKLASLYILGYNVFLWDL